MPHHELLLASPACQGHSLARGKGRPHHDAQGATAWAVVNCAEVHQPRVVLVENVPEFASLWRAYPAWWMEDGEPMARLDVVADAQLTAHRLRKQRAAMPGTPNKPLPCTVSRQIWLILEIPLTEWPASSLLRLIQVPGKSGLKVFLMAKP